MRINEYEWKGMKMSGNEWKMNKYEWLNEWRWMKWTKIIESDCEKGLMPLLYSRVNKFKYFVIKCNGSWVSLKRKLFSAFYY